MSAEVISIKKDEPEITVPKILCIVLCGYERHNWVCPDLMEWVSLVAFNQDFATMVRKAYNFIPAASARNFAAQQCLRLDPAPDWLLMLDNDQSPPINLYDTIKSVPKDAMVVVPKFHLFDGEKTTKLCWGIDEADFSRLPDGPGGFKKLEDNQYVQLNKCGTGCVFIRPELFKKIPPPWFEYKYDPMGSMVGTEDIAFCEKVIAAGMKIYGYTGVVVGHHHTCDLSILDKIFHGFEEDENTKNAKNNSQLANS